MAKYNFKTPTLELKYCNIKGNGVERDGENYYIVKALIEKGSKLDKQMQKLVKEIYEELDVDIDEYECKFYKPYVVPDPNSKRNKPNKIRDWVETDYNVFTAKTRTEFPSGDPKKVMVAAYDGSMWYDATDEYQEMDGFFGEGTKAVVYATASDYEVKSNSGVTAYLNKVQIIKPVISQGSQPLDEDVEAEEAFTGFGKKSKAKNKDNKDEEQEEPRKSSKRGKRSRRSRD